MVQSLLKSEIKAWFVKSGASELYAHLLYQNIANQLQRLGLFGAQKYFLKESEDEIKHYNILVGFVNDMSDVLSVPAVPEMKDKVMNLKDALEIAYETELELMRQYQKFYEEAEDKYGDCVTATFLVEFLQIQRKSVGSYSDLLIRLSLGGDLYAFDKEMGKLA
jgi:ferritin